MVPFEKIYVMGNINLSTIITVIQKEVINGGSKLQVEFTIPEDPATYFIEEDISFLGISDQSPNQPQSIAENTILVGAEWAMNSTKVQLLYDTIDYNDLNGNSVVKIEIPNDFTLLGEPIPGTPGIIDTIVTGIRNIAISLFGRRENAQLIKSSLKTANQNNLVRSLKTKKTPHVHSQFRHSNIQVDHDPHDEVAHNKMHIIRVSKFKKHQGYHKAIGNEGKHMLISPQQLEVMKYLYSDDYDDDGNEILFGENTGGSSDQPIVAVLHITDGVDGPLISQSTDSMDGNINPHPNHYYVTKVHSPNY